MWLKDALLGILAGSPHFAFLAPKLIDIPEGLALRVDSGLSTNVLVSDDHSADSSQLRLQQRTSVPTPSRTDQGQRIGKLQRAHRVPISTLSLG